MKRTIYAATMLLGLNAGNARAQDRNLRGSEILYDMMMEPLDGVMTNCLREKIR